MRAQPAQPGSAYRVNAIRRLGESELLEREPGGDSVDGFEGPVVIATDAEAELIVGESIRVKTHRGSKREVSVRKDEFHGCHPDAHLAKRVEVASEQVVESWPHARALPVEAAIIIELRSDPIT